MGKTERIIKLRAALLGEGPLLDASGWATVLEVDTRTVQRDLRFLRHQLGLDIYYDRDSKGYRAVGRKLSPMQESKKRKRLGLVDLLHRITAEPGKTGKQLALEMSCSERTMARHIRDLEELGFPIYNDRGYRILADAFLAPLSLDPDELLSLFLGARLLESQSDDEFGPSARRGLEKLVRGLSSKRRPDLTALRSSVQISSPVEDTGVDHLLELHAVIGRGKQVKLNYHGINDESARERIVDPMGLFGLRQVWYLHAFDHLRSDFRNFRLSRVLEWELLETPAVHASQMDLNKALYNRWDLDDGKPLPVRIRVTDSLRRWLAENPPHPTQTLEADIVSYSVSDFAAVARWAASLHGLEILEPPALRDEMAKLGENLRGLYS